jgi:hypothetical protein
MSQTTFTAEDLKKLPLRAIVAFAVRNARRVEHLAVPPDGHPKKEAVRAAIAEGLWLAEDFARGRSSPALEDAVVAIEAGQEAAQVEIARENAYAAVVRAIHAAATAAHAIAEEQEPADKPLISGGPPVKPLEHVAQLSADLAALGAFTAARDAAEALRSTDDVTESAAEDYRKLLELRLGKYPEAGEPIDPSPEGPLGPLRAEAGGP